MRRWLVLASVLLVGCAGPHSSGGLWAQQHLQNELVRFRLSDAERAATARSFELGLADDALAQERARLAAMQAGCPAAPAPLGISPGDRVRDGIRVQAQGDPRWLGSVAQLALADWWLRRAASTGDAHFCALAQAALDGQVEAGAATSDPLGTLPEQTVLRDPARPGTLVSDEPPTVAVSLYALGWADGVRGPAPLPQYIAAVYGGYLSPAVPPPALADRSAEQVVDELAPAHPEWEPDALYLALRSP